MYNISSSKLKSSERNDYMKNIVITIGREFGSGGREIGCKLSEKLGLPFYDKELISRVAEKIQCGEGAIEFYEEKAPALLFAPNSLFATYEMPMSDKIFIAQSHVIEEIASKESCIIIGRCADHILKDNPNLFSVFIHADIESRIERKSKIVTDIPKDKMKAHILGIDKKRAKYYGYYTDSKWGMASTYNLSLDSGMFGIDGCVDIIAQSIEKRV